MAPVEVCVERIPPRQANPLRVRILMVKPVCPVIVTPVDRRHILLGVCFAEVLCIRLSAGAPVPRIDPLRRCTPLQSEGYIVLYVYIMRRLGFRT
jgi:hypothetical protein